MNWECLEKAAAHEIFNSCLVVLFFHVFYGRLRARKLHGSCSRSPLQIWLVARKLPEDLLMDNNNGLNKSCLHSHHTNANLFPMRVDSIRAVPCHWSICKMMTDRISVYCHDENGVWFRNIWVWSMSFADNLVTDDGMSSSYKLQHTVFSLMGSSQDERWFL